MSKTSRAQEKRKKREQAKAKARSKEKSRLSQMKQSGSKLLSPTDAMKDLLKFHSWQRNRFPEMLWAAVIQAQCEREQWLGCFRSVCSWWFERKHITGEKGGTGGHSWLAHYGDDFTCDFVRFLKQNLRPPEILRPLLLVTNLPAYECWRRELNMTPVLSDWDIIKEAIVPSYDHQSQESTDLRWLRVWIMVALGRICYSQDSEQPKWLFEYPHKFDQKMVRPHIRATEGALSELIQDGSWPEKYGMRFWEFVYQKTARIPVSVGNGEERVVAGATLSQFRQLRERVADRALDSRQVARDNRHDVVFGLVLLTIATAIEICEASIHQSHLGRMGLRLCVENLVNLSYLLAKEDAELWRAFKQYGYSQANLITLKQEDRDIRSSCFDSGLMDIFATEEMARMYQEIELGDWTKENARKRAVIGDVSSTYDRLYDYTSAFSHGNWLAVAATSYDHDLNPLHLTQRLPKRRAARFASVEDELTQVVSQIVGLLDKAYPVQN